ncbi:MAG: outer membrane beta-barrel protein [Alphaproteobacteria bacterium]|jgi:opacity protein-like surface antigen|nr:outer membrane beta-barrel protein [Alphaproteobacteria bacterium]
MVAKSLKGVVLALLAGTALPLTAAAQDWYAGASVSWQQQNDSSNSGSTGAFTTGNGSPTVPFGTEIAEGTSYGWETEFDGGYGLAGEVGLRRGDGWRGGLELTYTNSDVDSHGGVTLGGAGLDGVDAAVLTGAQEQLGASVGEVVGAGEGDISSVGLFANGYYDFNTAGQFQPYLGAGLGFMDVDVEYSPSGVGIIDGGETKFAWQLKAGATWRVTERWDVYGEYAYRQSDDIEVNNDLFPGSLDIENQQNLFSVGTRIRFDTY